MRLRMRSARGGAVARRTVPLETISENYSIIHENLL